MPIQNYYTPAAGQQKIPYYQVLTSSGTWNLPAGYGADNPLTAYVVCIGGGGGGGSGGTGGSAMSSSTGSSQYSYAFGGYGGVGGSGGQASTGTLSLTGNVSYSVGAAGSGGAARPYYGNIYNGFYVGQTGNAGSSGGTTTFSTISASGGAGGSAGNGADSGNTGMTAQTVTWSVVKTAGESFPNNVLVNSAFSTSGNAVGGRGGAPGSGAAVGITRVQNTTETTYAAGACPAGTTVSPNSNSMSGYGNGGGGGAGGYSYASWGGYFGGGVYGSDYCGASSAGGNGGQGFIVIYYLD